MIKAIKKVTLFSVFLGLVSCGGGDKKPVNNPPSGVNLVYPTQDLLCVDNRIEFDWSDATDPDKDKVSYRLTVAKNRDLSSPVKSQKVSSSNVTISLEKGMAYYWSVTAVDSKGKEGEASSVYAFSTKGEGEVNVAPFTAALVNPSNEGNVSGTSVELKWKGADSNPGDTLKYDVFFGEDSNPALKESSLENETFTVDVESGKTYYWKVNTSDNSGAKSIGQVWSFKVE